LIEFLKNSEDVWTKIFAIRALGGTGDPRGVAPLADILKSAPERIDRTAPDPNGHRFDIYDEAASSLAKIGQPSVQVLKSMSKSSNYVTQKLAIMALDQIKAKNTPRLPEELTEQSVEIRLKR
jgi:HEAT repeat protein